MRKNYSPNILYKVITKLFVKFINFSSNIKLHQETSYVCLIDKEVINILKNMNETSRYYPGLIRWTGFDVSFIECQVVKKKIWEI